MMCTSSGGASPKRAAIHQRPPRPAPASAHGKKALLTTHLDGVKIQKSAGWFVKQTRTPLNSSKQSHLHPGPPGSRHNDWLEHALIFQTVCEDTSWT